MQYYSDTPCYKKVFHQQQLSFTSKSLIRREMLGSVQEFHRLQGWVTGSPAAGYLAGIMLADLGGLAAAW